MGLNIEQFAHFLRDFHIKIDQELPLTFKKRANVVSVKFEEWAFTVSRL